MPRVRYIGPNCAILAGTYILEGEDREVTAAQLAAAQLDHPEGFVVLDEPVPETAQITLNEPAPPASGTLDLSGGSLSTGGPATLDQSSTDTARAELSGLRTPTAKPQQQPKRRH